MLDSRDIGGLQGAPVIGRDKEKLGTVGQVFLDATSGAPNWVTVKTGLFGHKETFVPLANADWNGEELVVDIDKETLKEAPRVDAGEALSQHNEEALYRYYGLSDTDTDGGTARPGEYPDREDTTDENGRTVAPVPAGLADADRARNDDDSRDDVAAASRRSDASPSEDADLDKNDRDDWKDAHDRYADRPRNLEELHPAEADLRQNESDPHDLRLSEQPLGEPTTATTADNAPHGKHAARMRRYDPATDGASATGEPTSDRTDPPRTL